MRVYLDASEMGDHFPRTFCNVLLCVETYHRDEKFHYLLFAVKFSYIFAQKARKERAQGRMLSLLTGGSLTAPDSLR